MLEVNGKQIELCQHGYLTNPEDWDKDVAQALADSISFDLNSDNWVVVEMVRNHYEERQAVPEARTILKGLKEQYGAEKATRKYLYQLFPFGFAQQACKIAGMRIPLKLMLDL